MSFDAQRKKKLAGQRASHRNPQLPKLRKGSVHPMPTNPANPTPKPRPKRRIKKGAYKLNDRTITALIDSINRSCDAPVELHCGRAGIHRDTFSEWRKLALEEPESEHARQMAKVDKALYAAWGRLHEAAVKHKASEVLFRRHHEFYPSERQRLELTGAGGLPLIPSDPFTVLIELDPRDEPEPKKPFQLVHPDGSRERLNGTHANGQIE